MNDQQRRERCIAALERMGYEARHWGYSDDWGTEIDGYSIFKDDERYTEGFADYESEAWDDMLKCIQQQREDK